ncbi:unnamed protein product [Dracunculus medinensis]|uniref:FH2 domain-containing protein n=1 Tax=Dracunculus medinensis TaxID=318479 RepID=A0A0N4U793_DRAME|nr:unnamed protein product [Dracunculus medinensis]
MNFNNEDFDPLNAHGGIFRSFKWTREELKQISLHHAVAEYDKLINLMKAKLQQSKEIPTSGRLKIEKFLAQNEPPPAVIRLLDPYDKSSVRGLFLSLLSIDAVVLPLIVANLFSENSGGAGGPPAIKALHEIGEIGRAMDFVLHRLRMLSPEEQSIVLKYFTLK